MNIPGLLDAIGLFSDEELARSVEDKYIAVDFDYATIFSLLFLHPLRHRFGAAKQEFLAQQVDLKWLMLNK